jgi:hypothetical protein
VFGESLFAQVRREHAQVVAVLVARAEELAQHDVVPVDGEDAELIEDSHRMESVLPA